MSLNWTFRDILEDFLTSSELWKGLGELFWTILTISKSFGLFPCQFWPFLIIFGESERKRYGPTNWPTDGHTHLKKGVDASKKRRYSSVMRLCTFRKGPACIAFLEPGIQMKTTFSGSIIHTHANLIYNLPVCSPTRNFQRQLTTKRSLTRSQADCKFAHLKECVTDPRTHGRTDPSKEMRGRI